MEYPVDEHTIAFWPMDDDTNVQSTRDIVCRTAAETSFPPDFTEDGGETDDDSTGVNLGIVSGLNFERTQAFSVSAWVIPLCTGSSDYTVISNNPSSVGAAQRGWEFTLATSSMFPQLRLVNTATTNECRARATGTGIVDALQHHVVVTYDGTSLANATASLSGIKFYVDGVLRPTNGSITNTLSATIVSTSNTKIGKSPSPTSVNPAQGQLYNVSVWDIALTAGNVTTLFNAGTPGDLLAVAFVANLVSWWKIDITDDYTVTGGIVDHKSGFNGTGEDSLGILTAAALVCNNDRIPHFAGGPRQWLDLGPDNCRWFNKTTGNASQCSLESGRSPTGSGAYSDALGQCVKCFIGSTTGSPWTFEGWMYLDRDPAVTVSFDTATTFTAIAAFDNGGNSNNVFTMVLLSNRRIRVTWDAAQDASTQTSDSTVSVPVREWFHFAVISSVTGATRNVQFYIKGVDSGLATGKSKPAQVDLSGNAWLFGQPITGGSFNTSQFWGGMAYFRLSNKARSLSEIAAAVADPGSIVNDENTVVLWGLQENPHIRDESPYGLHLINRDIIEGNTPTAPNDVFGAQGPSESKKSHVFPGSVSNMSQDGPIQQFVADLMCGANEYTIETLFRADNDLSTNKTLYYCGANSGHTTIHSNLALLWRFLTNRKLQVYFEGEQRVNSLATGVVVADVINLAKSLRLRFALHRLNSPTAFHVAIDSTNVTTAAIPSDQATVNALLNEIKVDFNAHIASAIFHTVGDTNNSVVAANATNLATSITLANDIQDKFLRHGINTGGNYHPIMDDIPLSGLNSYSWFATSSNEAIVQAGTQSGELGIWYGFAVRKRSVGGLLYWKLSESPASDDAISMGNAAQFSFERTNAFTLIIWFNGILPSPTAAGSAIQHLIGKSDSGANATGYSLFLGTDGRLTFRMGNGAAGAGNSVQVSTNSSAPAQVNTFQNCLAVTYDGTGTAASGTGVSGVKLFANGVRATNLAPVATPLNLGSAITAAPFTIGRRNLTDQPLGGYVREASVWNRELTAAEILEAYGSSGRPPPDLLTTTMASALIGYWKFDQSDTGATVFDHSVSAVNGTPQGGLVPTSKPSAEWDFYVNGIPFETVGPLPSPVIGDIMVAEGNQYFQSVHIGTSSEKDSRALTRISDIARTDEEILEYHRFATQSGAAFNYKMRAVDDGAPAPGFVYWITSFPDFEASLVGNSTPPLVGNVVPGSVIELTRWIAT